MMKNKILATMETSAILSTIPLSARPVETSGEPHSAVQVTFFPPLGINGRHAAEYTITRRE